MSLFLGAWSYFGNHCSEDTLFLAVHSVEVFFQARAVHISVVHLHEKITHHIHTRQLVMHIKYKFIVALSYRSVSDGPNDLAFLIEIHILDIILELVLTTNICI